MKYKVGMYGGSFNPIHLGHVNNIISAANMTEKLYVILSYSLKRKEILFKERLMWIKNITKDIENVVVLAVKDDDTSKGTYDWNKGAKDIKTAINEDIDVVFCGSDYEGKNLFEKLYPNSKIHYFSRDLINISSTQIRENPYKYWDYIPNEVKPYFTKKIVVVGTESCGKSTLVRNLAKVYNTNYVEEVGREICEAAGGIDNMQLKHYIEILFKHKVKEYEKLKKANKLIFIDSEAIITKYYYELGFKDTEEYKENFSELASYINCLNDYDLYLFLEPDVKWIDDGTRTYGDDSTRKNNNELLKHMLRSEGIKFIEISGNYEDRFTKTKKIIDDLINSKSML